MPDETKPRSNSYEVVSKLTASRQRARAEAKRLAAEKSELEKRIAELEKAPKADDAIKQRDEAVKQLRSRDHRAAFDKVADELKVRKDARDDLWELSKLDTSAETPDPAAIKAALEPKVKDRAYLLDAAGAAPARLNPGPGGDRGGQSTVVGEFRVPPGGLSDGEWMRSNQDALQAAHAEGKTVVYE